MDTSNQFLVGARADDVTILRHTIGPGMSMTKDEALNLAAYLVLVADPLGDKFQALLEAIQST